MNIKPPETAAAFAQELKRFANDDFGNASGASLYHVIAMMKAAAMPSENYRIYKRRALEYIADTLANCSQKLQNAFFEFILQSQLVDEDEEVRDSLFHLLRMRRNTPIDSLFVNIVSSISRTRRNPTRQLLIEVRPIVLGEFRARPAWNLIPVMTRLIATGSVEGYSRFDFLRDLARLDNGAEFDRNIRKLNSLWQQLEPQMDSISVLLATRRADPVQARDHPTPEKYQNSFAASAKKLNRRIVGAISN